MTSNMKGDTTLPVSDLPPHKVFNMLNNSSCMNVLDFRSPENFERKHIKKSVNLTTECVFQAKEMIIDLVRAQRGLFGMLILFDEEETDLEALKILQDFIVEEYNNVQQAILSHGEGDILTKNWRKLEYVHQASFTIFENKYSSCEKLFEGRGKHPYVGFNYYASEIIPDFLFLGDYQNATDRNELKAMRITHIVDATGTELSRDRASELGINYLPVNIWDCPTSNIAEHFASSNAFIMSAREKNGRVLVHCRAGVSRSASLVAAYMMHAACCVRNDTAAIPRTLAEVIKHIILERPIICPNSSFQKQLIIYEFELFNENSFTDDTKFLDLIHVESKLYSGDHATETDHDRMPIQALKTLKPEASWTWENAFPTSETLVVTDPVAKNADPSQPAVLKKNFLKRNPQRIVKQKITGGKTTSATDCRDVPRRVPLKERVKAAVVDSKSSSILNS